MLLNVFIGTFLSNFATVSFLFLSVNSFSRDTFGFFDFLISQDSLLLLMLLFFDDVRFDCKESLIYKFEELLSNLTLLKVNSRLKYQIGGSIGISNIRIH